MAKSADAFRTISEVAEWLDVPAHVLRFWESKFTQIKPVKRAGGRRYYRPSDMALIGGIKRLLHDDGMTIKGVQKILREQGVKHVAGMAPQIGDGAELDIEVAEEPPAGTVVEFRGGAQAGRAAETGTETGPEAQADTPAPAEDAEPPAPEAPQITVTEKTEREPLSPFTYAAEHNRRRNGDEAGRAAPRPEEAAPPTEEAPPDMPAFLKTPWPIDETPDETEDAPDGSPDLAEESTETPAEPEPPRAHAFGPGTPSGAPETPETPATGRVAPDPDAGTGDADAAETEAPEPDGPAPAGRQPLGAGIPDDPDEAKVAAAAGPLAHLGRVRRLSREDAARIQPLIARLRRLQDVGAPRA